MIQTYLSSIWAPVAPTMANHLWQSTLFAVVVGMLTLALHKNQARIRYWLWLAASLKFLLPFSLLVDIGSHLTRSHNSAALQPSLYAAMEVVSQPFTQATTHVPSPVARAVTHPAVGHLLPVLFAAIWLCGFCAVLLVWFERLRRISAAMRGATRLREGREVETLRRLERVAGIRKPIGVILSRASLEPGVFGILRPVLLWPQGISARLDDAHLEAILAHEVLHVRRRDNQAAAIHMLVEAIFWFHPLVWWLGARLVEERERACDEEVLRMGSAPHVYAESILKACEFCVASPLACVSGVTGADLKQRIVRIMTEGVTNRLDFRRKLLLGGAGILAVAVPLVFGLQQAADNPAGPATANTADVSVLNHVPMKFEVASIKQDKGGDGQHLMMRIMNAPNDGRFYASNVTVKTLLRMAYNVQDSQITGGPSWLNSERFDIEATSDSSVDDVLRKLPPADGMEAKRRMVQALLADRFQLTLGYQTKDLPVYALVVAKGGPKLPKTNEPDGIAGPSGRMGPGSMMRMTGRGEIAFERASMPTLAQFLAQQLGRTVLDKTGLSGDYDFSLHWTPAEGEGMMPPGPPGPPGSGNGGPGPAGAPSSDPSGPSIFTALQEQLGLKLDSQKGPVEVLAIEHVEQPSAN